MNKLLIVVLLLIAMSCQKQPKEYCFKCTWEQLSTTVKDGVVKNTSDVSVIEQCGMTDEEIADYQLENTWYKESHVSGAWIKEKSVMICIKDQ